MTMRDEEPTKRDEWVAAGLIVECARLAVGQGAPADAVLQTVQWEDGQVPEAPARLPYHQAVKVWTEAARWLPNRALGLHFAEASIVGPRAMTQMAEGTRTRREALYAAAKSLPKVTTGARLEWECAAGLTQLRLQYHPLIVEAAHPLDFVLAQIVRMVRGSDRGVALHRVSLPHAPLGPRSTYHQTFGERVDFEQEHASIVFLDEALDRPRAEPDLLLSLVERTPIDRFVASLDHRPSGFRTELERAVDEVADDGQFYVEALARRMAMSPRTVQRRALAAGCEVGGLLANARRARAETLLENPGLSLREVAERLGYSHERSFTRAFVRWTGETPAQWRRRRESGKRGV